MHNTNRRRVVGLLTAIAALAAVQSAAGAFTIGNAAVPAIVVPAGTRPFVAKAAEDVAGDIERIFGARPKVVVGASDASSPAENAIVLLKSGGGWENYAIESAQGNVLRITGSCDRGLMFGLYRFASDCLGVDPFYRWSGLEPGRRESMTWDRISIRQGDPSFKFRGWFINDEDFLNGFRPKENGVRKINYPRYHVVFGPSVAEAICETAVHAGFNMMVCASYVDILNPDEKRLIDIASSRGLYVTMHHQEPVGAGALQLDLHFPEIRGTTYASHPDLWRKAWRRYIGEWAKFPDVVWQIGLRGRRDTPFWAVHGVPASAGKPDEAEDRRRAGLISAAMREQLAMIEEATGRRPEHTATQLWWEGADFYARGLLDIPNDTIVVFSDNSAGFKLQPDIGGVKSLDPEKRFGIYYHLALVHGNHRCEVVPPLRTQQILGFAHEKGAVDFVLFNVSNVRPFLYTLAAAGEMSRDLVAFDADGFRDRWTKARFGGRAESVARAIDLYFAAYETEYSRDKVSSYGSSRERAPLAILHDGMLCRWIVRQVDWFASGRKGAVAPVASQYEKDPDRLVRLPDNLYNRATHDQEPNLEDESRTRIRAVAQAAAFERCEEQIGRAAAGMDDEQRRQLFERFGYPAAFMRLSSLAFAELSAAREARCLGDEPGAMRHAKSALSLMEERDALDGRYASGRWSGWYDRDLLYPCRSVTARLRAAFRRDVYLLIGQSNMAGRGALSPSNRVSSAGTVKFTADMRWVPADEPIHFDKNTAGAGLAATFARTMADVNPGREIALVPCAVGGSAISRWQPGADLYRNAVERTKAALASGGVLKGILWHQGETDAGKQECVNAYEGQLRTLVAAIRKDLNAEDVPFVAGELADAQCRRRDGMQWDAISAATRRVMASCPLCGCVSSQGLRLKDDGLHFDTASQRIFGRRYAEKLQEIIQGQMKK